MADTALNPCCVNEENRYQEEQKHRLMGSLDYPLPGFI